MTISGSDDIEQEHLGDPFPLQRSYAELTEQEIAQIFGRTPLVAALFTAPEQRWSGPVRSGYGWHLIFVSKRTPQTVEGFAKVRERVRDGYLAEQRRAANEEQYRALQSRYSILQTSGQPSE
jgi:hypothetical protein